MIYFFAFSFWMLSAIAGCGAPPTGGVDCGDRSIPVGPNITAGVEVGDDAGVVTTPNP